MCYATLEKWIELLQTVNLILYTLVFLAFKSSQKDKGAVKQEFWKVEDNNIKRKLAALEQGPYLGIFVREHLSCTHSISKY